MTQQSGGGSTPPIPQPPVQQPTEPVAAMHWDGLLQQEFARESDRACVIVAVALLDSALECLLKSRLVACASSNDSLVDGSYAPISTFSARVDLAHRIGLISARFTRDLHLIRKIRNEFAHNITGASFEDASVRSRVLELSRSHCFADRNPDSRRQHFPPGPKGDFQLSVSWMQWYLRDLASRVRPMDAAPQEWGYGTQATT